MKLPRIDGLKNQDEIAKNCQELQFLATDATKCIIVVTCSHLTNLFGKS